MEITKILFNQITLEKMFVIFSVLVTFDVLCGMVKAWKQGRFKSRTLRDGLFGSMGELILLVLCIFSTELIPYTCFIVFSLLVYMSLKELYSIVENLLVIGVKFPDWLVKGLQVFIDQTNNLDFKGDNEDGKL